MARPMNALPVDDGRLVSFAAALRAARERAGAPSLAEMSLRCGVCVASLSDAHGGRKLPTWRTVDGYLRACGADPVALRPRWEGLRLAQRTARADVRHTAVLKRWATTREITPPQWVRDPAELALLLDHMRRFRGLSLRGLACRSTGFSHHTYGAVLRGDRPVTADVLAAVLHACGVRRAPARRWFLALARVRPEEAPHVRGVLLAAEAPPSAPRPPGARGR
ncbi:helix-turn-helix domain-containing protein [Streptomyces sp. NPDC057702]|uniref:helix-turn-helix domain-containing protein n=1 Tax=unclassified Streptomyces TaxID=2593676 RepID=UPI003696501D